MKHLHDIYKSSFFSRRYRLGWRVPLVCDAIIGTFNLNIDSSIIDVGCAIGEYVAGFNKRGITAEGIEGSKSAIDFFESPDIYVLDLRKPLPLKTRYSLCMSLEVAEHIEPEYADQYIKNLISLSDKILITAAPPGQGGHYHVNCQDHNYWTLKFLEYGYIRKHKKESVFKSLLYKASYRKEIVCYINNVMIFEG